MSVSGWNQLAVADAFVTSTLIDSCDIISHKILSPDSNDTINDELVVTLTDAYEKALVDFAFAPVSYLPEQRFTNLGVFGKRDNEMGSKIELMGFLAEIPKFCDLLVDANVPSSNEREKN